MHSASDAITFTRHVRYVDDDIACAQFLSSEACNEVVELAEQYAKSNGGWTQDDPDFYEYTTNDLEVDKIPPLRSWLIRARFIDQLQVFNRKIAGFDDVFIVRYTLGEQTSLQMHTDAGDISFMIALSEPGKDYSGGGTYFEDLGEVVTMKKGDMLIFNAKLFHQGVPITSGTRYLLIGFGYSSDATTTLQPGSIGLDFLQVVSTRTRP
eukprot:1188812-Prorocentrum_minimum.AAC.2